MSIPADTCPRLRPKRPTAAQLAKVGVELRDILSNSACLACERCGQAWSPNLRGGGRLPRGYWKCPNGCNGVQS